MKWEVIFLAQPISNNGDHVFLGGYGKIVLSRLQGSTVTVHISSFVWDVTKQTVLDTVTVTHCDSECMQAVTDCTKTTQKKTCFWHGFKGKLLLHCHVLLFAGWLVLKLTQTECPVLTNRKNMLIATGEDADSSTVQFICCTDMGITRTNVTVTVLEMEYGGT